MGTRHGRRRHPPTPSTATDSAATLAVALAAVTGGRGTTPLSDCPRRTDREYGIMHLPTRDGPVSGPDEPSRREPSHHLGGRRPPGERAAHCTQDVFRHQ